jgi:hypothetical protein
MEMGFPVINVPLVEEELKRLSTLHDQMLSDMNDDISYTYGWMYHALASACLKRVGVELRPTADLWE